MICQLFPLLIEELASRRDWKYDTKNFCSLLLDYFLYVFQLNRVENDTSENKYINFKLQTKA